jgi:succinyl-CoA synthetase beta subunit
MQCYSFISGLHSVRTGAATLHYYETISGIRFALYTSNTSDLSQEAVRSALNRIYTNIWVDCVVRSPLYMSSMEGTMDISSTNFEPTLDAYLQSMTWFR